MFANRQPWSALKNHPKNDRAKREYLIYLRDARQWPPTTVEQVRHAIDRLEDYTGFKDFGTFNKEQARGFKQALVATKGGRSGKPISTTTAHHVLQALKEFQAWLHGQRGYRRRIDPTDIRYLNLTANDERPAHAQPSEIFHSRPVSSGVVRDAHRERSRAARSTLFAFLLIRGMRDAAAISLRLKYISIEWNRVFQDPREVRTKFAKSIETFFYPVGEDVTAIVRDWVQFLITGSFSVPMIRFSRKPRYGMTSISTSRPTV